MVSLTPGRECGECTVCCKVLTIKARDLKKPAGVVCEHCEPKAGCRIYESRPRACRTLYCGWRLLPFGEEWRPDRSEILVVSMADETPDGLKGGLKFELVGALDRIGWKPLVDYIALLVMNNVPAYLSVPGEAGAGRVYLNGNAALKKAIALGDPSLAASILAAAAHACARQPKEKVTFTGAAAR